jgi:ketosteroid isomerase-like protein
MATTYVEPPKFTVAHLIGEGEFLSVVGNLTMKDENGQPDHYTYSDIWRFREGKIVELTAFVIKTEPGPKSGSES